MYDDVRLVDRMVKSNVILSLFLLFSLLFYFLMFSHFILTATFLITDLHFLIFQPAVEDWKAEYIF